MLTFDKLTDDELRHTVRCLVAGDRAQVVRLAEHLAEVETRRLQLRWGYSTLWDYCERELKLKDGSAHLRITLARLLKKKPELKPLLLDGGLGMCAACDLWPLVDAEDFSELVRQATELSKRAFRELLDQRRGRPLPKRDVIRRVASESAPAPIFAPTPTLIFATNPALNLQEPAPERCTGPTSEVQSTKVLAPPTKTHRISFMACEADVAMLDQLKDLLGTNEIGVVVARALAALLDKKDPKKRAERRRLHQARLSKQIIPSPSASAHEHKSHRRPRRPPAQVADAVRLRDKEQCTFVGADGTQCQSRRHLQIDHVVPFALGGSSVEPGGLRVLCAAHNLFLAREVFGTRVPQRSTASTG